MTLIANIVWGLKASIGDDESASFHKELKEEIYMDIPHGMNSKSNDFLLLKRTIDSVA
jgi:hypothetical protein